MCCEEFLGFWQSPNTKHRIHPSLNGACTDCKDRSIGTERTIRNASNAIKSFKFPAIRHRIHVHPILAKFDSKPSVWAQSLEAGGEDHRLVTALRFYRG